MTENMVEDTDYSENDNIENPTLEDGIDDTQSEESGEESQLDYTGTMHKINVDGEEQEISYEDMLKSAQLDKASYKRMEEASKLNKQVKPLLEILKAAKSGDVSVIKKLGIPKDALRKFSEDELLAAIEEEEMTPDQKRAHAAEQERDRLKAENKKIQDREFAAYQQHLEIEASNRIQTELQQAFKDSGIALEGNQRLVARVCEDRLKYSESGRETTMKESLQRALNSLNAEYSEYARRQFSKDPDSFLQSLPDDIKDGVRKKSINEVGSRVPMGTNSNKQTNKKVTSKDSFREYMRKEFQRRG